jgi:hypothetical protein
MVKPHHYWKQSNHADEQPQTCESGLYETSKLSDNARWELSGNDTSTSREDSHNDNPETSKRRSKWVWVVIAIVIVGVIMAIWVPLVAQPKNNNNQEVQQSEAEAERNKIPPMNPPKTDKEENEDDLDEDFVVSTDVPISSSNPDGAPAPSPAATATPAVVTPSPIWTSETIKFLQSISYAPERFLDTSSYEYAAAQWLDLYTVSIDVEVYPEYVAQRYALALLDMSLHNRNDVIFATTDSECEWFGIKCNNDTFVESISWNDQNLVGTIPPDVGLLENVISLDLGENQIQGQLPEGLFELENLVSCYLHDNQLTGTVSTSISKLSSLNRFFLSKNGFSGSFPFESCLGLPLQWLSVYDNQFTGQLPETLSWRYLYYFDLGKNQFSGTIPSMNSLVRLRHLYLDFNKFSGPLPSNWFQSGDGRMIQVIINDNEFTGQFPPEGYQVSRMLEAVEIQNNFFDRFNSDICKSSIWEDGELILLRSTCGFCNCNILCDSGRCVA